MERKKLTITEIVAAFAAIALSFAAVFASEYVFGNISIGLAVALGICLVWIIYDAVRLGRWWKKIQPWLTRPEKCWKCGDTEFRPELMPGKIIWKCKKCGSVVAFHKAFKN